MKPEDLPEILTPEVIETLVEMALEFPHETFDWANISKILDRRGQIDIILDKVEKIKEERERVRKSLMTEEEKQEIIDKIKETTSRPGYHFHGNMGEPDTPESYKDRYGVYPPNYIKPE